MNDLDKASNIAERCTVAGCEDPAAWLAIVIVKPHAPYENAHAEVASPENRLCAQHRANIAPSALIDLVWNDVREVLSWFNGEPLREDAEVEYIRLSAN